MTDDMLAIQEWFTSMNNLYGRTIYTFKESVNKLEVEDEDFSTEIVRIANCYYVTVGYADGSCDICRHRTDDDGLENFYDWFLGNYNNFLEDVDNKHMRYCGSHWSYGTDY